MIRVLVADDEKIVRKGLISFMPWSDFGMTVVGEANNGENALKFIEKNEVDLLLTDLSMPVMSGIELMREVRRKFPHIQFVVLTLHQDFEYVQEALRLGAIDYIAKTQLEKEQFEDVLGRIASLLKQKEPVGAEPVFRDVLEKVDELLVLYALNQQNHEMLLDTHLLKNTVEVDAGIWYWEDPQIKDEQDLLEKINKQSLNSELAFICFKDLKTLDRKSILQLLRIYQKNDLFYDYDSLEPFKVIHSEDVLMKKELSYNINSLKEIWLSGDWIHHNEVFEQMSNELKNLRMPPIRLTRLFFSITDEWNRLYRNILTDPIAIEDFLTSWVQFEKWLNDTREKLRVMNTKAPFSAEIQNSILRAAAIAQQMMDQTLTAGDVAKKVNMSSSYFSQCFKEIIGKTYTEYLRDIRMERAKDYLRNTTKTIQWIAEQVGYNDEKYFSRLFREHVGLLPSEYRQREIDSVLKRR
jgi:two-component system response regulator YesN